MSSSCLFITDEHDFNDISFELQSNISHHTKEPTPSPHDLRFDIKPTTIPITKDIKLRYEGNKDNDLIAKRIKPLILQLHDLELFYKKHEAKDDINSLLAMKDLNDQLMETCTDILGYYNVMLRHVSELRSDSALTVVPLVVTSLKLYDCLRYTVKTLIIFPYSLYYKLGINAINLCEEMILLKNKHKHVYKQRLLNGLLPVKQVHNEENVTKYVLLMIIYKMQQKIPEMHEEWVDMFWPTYKSKVTNLSREILEDQYKALDWLIKYYGNDDMLYEKLMVNKVKKIRDYLLKIDLDAFSADYWSDI